MCKTLAVAPLASRFRPDDQAAKVDKAVRAGEPVQVAPGSTGDDWQRRRGAPNIGRFTPGGAMFGSRPEREVLKLDRRKF